MIGESIQTPIAQGISHCILDSMTQAKLDTSLKQAVALGTPVEVVDPATNEIYDLVSAEQFRGLAALINSDFDPRETYPLVDLTMSNDDAQDPLLESYQ